VIGRITRATTGNRGLSRAQLRREGRVTLCLLFRNALRLCLCLGEVHEAAKPALSSGIVAQQKRREIFATNVTFVFVDLYRDITIANDVRPGFG